MDDTLLFIFWSFIYLRFEISNKYKKNEFFFIGFFVSIFLSPIIYSYISITEKDKRTDYPGKEMATKVQLIWSQNFEKEIEFVTGDEWKAGNLSYHLKSRPKWEGPTNNDILNSSSQFICVDDVCLGRY